MADRRLVLHVGAPKCGSSSLQAALANRPDIDAADARYRYVCFYPKIGVLKGRAVTARARMSASGYANTPNFRRGTEPAEVMAPLVPALRRMLDAGHVPILSSEGWMEQARQMRQSGLLEAVNGAARVIAYVRPPAEWINSAWWQWGVWTGVDLDTFVARRAKAMVWATPLAQWEKVPGVASVEVGLAARDVVADFAARLGLHGLEAAQINGTLPPAFLGFLQRNRRFRPDPHMPQVEFVVARHLDPARRSTPWVLRRDHLKTIFREAGAAATHRLLRRLTPEDRAAVEADPRWWQPDAFAERAEAAERAPDMQAEIAALLELHAALRQAAGRGSAPDAGEAARRVQAAPDAAAAIAVADGLIADIVDLLVSRDRQRRAGGLFARLRA